MSQQIPSQGPVTDGPPDPEHDPTASYALDRDYVAALTRRVVSSTGESVLTRSPIGGQPLAHVPQSSDDDVAAAFERARRAQAAWSRTSVDHRAELLLRLHDITLDRSDEILDV